MIVRLRVARQTIHRVQDYSICFEEVYSLLQTFIPAVRYTLQIDASGRLVVVALGRVGFFLAPLPHANIEQHWTKVLPSRPLPLEISGQSSSIDWDNYSKSSLLVGWLVSSAI